MFITGLQFDVKSAELQDLLNRQVDGSAKLSEDIESYVERLNHAAQSETTAQQLATANAARSIARARSESFKWLAKHVIPSETYRLSITELAQVGIVQGFGNADVNALPQMFQRPVAGTEQRANA